MPDRLSELYDAVAASRSIGSPWAPGGIFEPNLPLLQKLLQVMVANGKIHNAQTGGPALAVDVWIATELRRAGIDADAVWPRALSPRTLPQSLSTALNSFKFARDPATAAVQRKVLERLTTTAGSS